MNQIIGLIIVLHCSHNSSETVLNRLENLCPLYTIEDKVRKVLEYTILGCPIPYKHTRYRIGMTKYDCPLIELQTHVQRISGM